MRGAQEGGRVGRGGARAGDPAQRRADLFDQRRDCVLGSGARAAVELVLLHARHVWLEARQQQPHQRRRVALLPRLPQPLGRRLRVPPVVQLRLQPLAPRRSPVAGVERLRLCQPLRVPLARLERDLRLPRGCPREQPLDQLDRAADSQVADQIRDDVGEDEEEDRPPEHPAGALPAAEHHHNHCGAEQRHQTVDAHADHRDLERERRPHVPDDVNLDVLEELHDLPRVAGELRGERVVHGPERHRGDGEPVHSSTYNCMTS
mmetsp:Transcript_46064/g.144914  ORF Transcript_46064/g.144914 Transcript_46064/m.144914 type:complete len:262 (-) Transcript_46064:48-833(-)